MISMTDKKTIDKVIQGNPIFLRSEPYTMPGGMGLIYLKILLNDNSPFIQSLPIFKIIIIGKKIANKEKIL